MTTVMKFILMAFLTLMPQSNILKSMKKKRFSENYTVVLPLKNNVKLTVLAMELLGCVQNTRIVYSNSVMDKLIQ